MEADRLRVIERGDENSEGERAAATGARRRCVGRFCVFLISFLFPVRRLLQNNVYGLEHARSFRCKESIKVGDAILQIRARLMLRTYSGRPKHMTTSIREAELGEPHIPSSIALPRSSSRSPGASARFTSSISRRSSSSCWRPITSTSALGIACSTRGQASGRLVGRRGRPVSYDIERNTQLQQLEQVLAPEEEEAAAPRG